MGEIHMEFDESEENVYDEDSRERLVEDDALDAREAAFMRGYDEEPDNQF